MVAVSAFGQATLKHDMTNTLSRSLTLALKAGIFVLCCSVCIWWAYSMGAPGSFRTHHEAVLLTIQMAMLTTCLTAVVWIASSYIHKRVTSLSLGIKTALETGRSFSLHRRSARLEEQLDAGERDERLRGISAFCGTHKRRVLF